jgi:hypothetical protein
MRAAPFSWRRLLRSSLVRVAASVSASLAASLLLTSCGADDPPPTTPDTPPVTGERLLAAPPPGWIRTFALDKGGVRLVEFIPPGSDQQWIDKLSFESFKGGGTNALGDELPDPIRLIRNIAKERERVCDGSEDYNTFSGFENNYPTSVRLLLCHRNKASGRGEITMLKSIQGNTDFYVVQRTRRVDPFEDRPRAPMSDAEMGLWSLYFRSISVCDDTRPEHPCPAPQSPQSAETL